MGNMSLVVQPGFQHILRVLNTNIEGKTNIMFAMTSIKGVGRRYANIVLKKADIPLSERTWRDSRRSGLIVVCVITGVSESVASTPRQLVAVVALSVFPRRNKPCCVVLCSRCLALSIFVT